MMVHCVEASNLEGHGEEELGFLEVQKCCDQGVGLFFRSDFFTDAFGGGFRGAATMPAREMAKGRDDGGNPGGVQDDEQIGCKNDDVLLHIRYEHLESDGTFVSLAYFKVMVLIITPGPARSEFKGPGIPAPFSEPQRLNGTNPVSVSSR
jgi:hypothetical protein